MGQNSSLRRFPPRTFVHSVPLLYLFVTSTIFLAIIVLLLLATTCLTPDGAAWLMAFGPTIGSWHVTDTPSTVSATGALLLLIGSANFIYERGPGTITMFLPFIMVSASAILFLGLIDVGDTPGFGTLDLVAGTALTVLILKMFLLHRYAFDQPRRRADPELSLLPAREEDLDELDRMIRGEQDHGRVIPIVARWGEGKTVLLHALAHRWNGQRRYPTFIVVDVWKSESEHDLQVEIIRALLSHPHTRRRWKWLAIPVGFAFSGGVALLRTLKIRLSYPKGSAEAETDIRLPALTWQRLFERLSRFNPRGTVIALDELDRATPPVTQTAVTLARRSASLPQLTILLSYTVGIIQHKAFNPLLPTLPDLASTMEAVLFEEFSSELARIDPDSGRSTFSQADPGADNEKKEPPRPWKDITSSGPLGERLLDLFAGQQPGRRQRVQARFEEKYLGAQQLTVRRLTPEDLAVMFSTFPNLGRQAESLLSLKAGALKAKDPTDAAATAFLNRLRKSALELGKDRGHPTSLWDYGYPPTRVLLRKLHQILGSAENLRRSTTGSHPLPPELMAVMVLMALDWAIRIYSSSPETDS